MNEPNQKASTILHIIQDFVHYQVLTYIAFYFIFTLLFDFTAMTDTKNFLKGEQKTFDFQETLLRKTVWQIKLCLFICFIKNKYSLLSFKLQESIKKSVRGTHTYSSTKKPTIQYLNALQFYSPLSPQHIQFYIKLEAVALL